MLLRSTYWACRGEDLFAYEGVANGQQWQYGEGIAVFAGWRAFERSEVYWPRRKLLRCYTIQRLEIFRSVMSVRILHCLLGYMPTDTEYDVASKFNCGSIAWFVRLEACIRTVVKKVLYREQESGWAPAKSVHWQVLETAGTGNVAVDWDWACLCGVLGWKISRMQSGCELFRREKST